MTKPQSTRIGIWRMADDLPMRLKRAEVELENHLEDWIERDPSLLQSGLHIVGRQVRCDTGRMDLLAIDLHRASWAIIEIKRGDLRRDTVIQVIDYIGSLRDMPTDHLLSKINTYLGGKGESWKTIAAQFGLDDTLLTDRNITVYVVGTGRDIRLDQILELVAVPVTVVDFDVFADSDGTIHLTRQLTDYDNAPAEPHAVGASNANEVERLLATADENGIGPEFRSLHAVATRHGLYPRTYKHSIMYTPPQHKGRCLVVAWVKPSAGNLKCYVVPEAFAEFFPVSEKSVIDYIGEDGYRTLPASEMEAFTEALDAVMKAIHAADDENG